MSKPKLTKEQAQLYNELLVLNWNNPYIERHNVLNFTGESLNNIAITLEALEAKGFLLTGREDVGEGHMATTHTPITKSGAYGYPADDFKDFIEWIQQNEVAVPDAI